MKNSRMIYARRAGFAALLGLAAHTHAQYGPPTINFCPPSNGTNYNLIQGGATYNLTCDVDGTRFTIVQNGIKLNGNGHWMTFTQGDGITVTGLASSISNITLSRPKGNGIHYIRSTNTQLSTEYISNVTVSWPWYDGVSRAGAPYTSVSVQSSNFVMCSNGFALNNTDEKKGARYIDAFDTYMEEGIGGFQSLNAATQHHSRNHYTYNSNYGAFDFTDFNNNNAYAQYYTGNNFDGNSNDGIIVSNNGSNTITLSGNSGTGNQSDCWANRGTGVIATDNTWTVNNGCVSNR